MYNPMDAVKEFHDTFAPDQRDNSLSSKLDRRRGLIYEEAQETDDAIRFMEDSYCNMTSYTLDEAKEELAKELADLLYVVYGTAEELGIPLQEVFEAVHKSNMSKAAPDGTVKRNSMGKVLKPDTYVKPDLSFIHEHRVL